MCSSKVWLSEQKSCSAVGAQPMPHVSKVLLRTHSCHCCATGDGNSWQGGLAESNCWSCTGAGWAIGKRKGPSSLGASVACLTPQGGNCFVVSPSQGLSSLCIRGIVKQRSPPYKVIAPNIKAIFDAYALSLCRHHDDRHKCAGDSLAQLGSELQERSTGKTVSSIQGHAAAANR